MNGFVQRFSDKIKGVITGFDRIVFKGCFRSLMFAQGASSFLRSQGVLNKNYKEWVMEQSGTIIQSADELSLSVTGGKVIPFKSIERKEEVAHEQQNVRDVKEGLIGVWSAVEPCITYQACYDATKGFPQLQPKFSRCKHLYFYFDHAQYGFMSVRLQTWFPYGIQIALNGREWLRRSLDQQRVGYVVHGNKFLHIDDYELAQTILTQQLDTRWVEMLGSFVPTIFPAQSAILGDLNEYYWTLWQSEWATDYLFTSPEVLLPLKDNLLRHAFMTGTCDRVLRYMGRPIDARGQPHPRSNPELISRASQWHDGMRVRHWLNNNSVKIYNEHNVLRVETTMNNPGNYRVWRHSDKHPDAPKKMQPLRKGVADIPIRAKLSDEINHRFIEQMNTVEESTPIKEVIRDITKPFTKQSKRIRSLDLFGKDRELLLALSDPRHTLNGITNKQLQTLLADTPWAKKKSGKQLSARISRHLRLLRDHGVIQKVTKQRRYQLTANGQTIITALTAILAASTQQLVKTAA